MAHRGKVPNCKAETGVKGPIDGIRWYVVRDSTFDEFACCEACYEDVLYATSFRDHFVLSMAPIPVETTIVCDLAKAFIRRAATEYSVGNSWDEFMDWTRFRMKLPVCNDLKSAKCSTTMWYMPNPQIYGVAICGACFHDGVNLTPMAGSFMQVDVPDNRKEEMWECANSILPMRIAWMEANTKKNTQIWYSAARSISNHPPCTKDGIQGGVWHSLEGCSNFGVCGRCFAGILNTQGYGANFKPLAGPTDGSAYVCDFHPSKPRFLGYLEKLDQAVSTRNWPIFEDHIRRVAPQPACPRDGAVQNRRWYCGTELTVCESCYEEAIRGTSLSGELVLQERPDECICDIYSPRMRRQWADACAKDDLEGFNGILRHRMMVYGATVPRMRTIQQLMLIRMQTRNTLLLSSAMLQGADGIASAAMPAGAAHNYENSHIGHHWATYAGAESEIKFQEAMSMNVMPTGDIAEMAQLEQIWRQVE